MMEESLIDEELLYFSALCLVITISPLSDLVFAQNENGLNVSH